MPKISICTPCWVDKDAPENKRQPRYEMFLRAAQSIFSQTNHDFEWVIVDDMSNPSIYKIMEDLNPPDWLNYKVIRLDQKGGRIIARNRAMKEATGEWLYWFDSDDELSSIYVDGMIHAINTYPEFKVFNFNHLIIGYTYDTNVRRFINMEVQDDNPFGSGHIGTGAFVFSREVYEKVGPLPELGLWDFAKEFLDKHPECKPFFEAEGRPGQYHSLGNPFGDDYYYFYSITRHFKSKYLDWAPYIVHTKFGHKWPEEPEIEGNLGDKPSWNPQNI